MREQAVEVHESSGELMNKKAGLLAQIAETRNALKAQLLEALMR